MSADHWEPGYRPKTTSLSPLDRVRAARALMDGAYSVNWHDGTFRDVHEVDEHLAALEAELLRERPVLYRSVKLPSEEPVQYVGCYVLRWGNGEEPTVGFVRSGIDD